DRLSGTPVRLDALPVPLAFGPGGKALYAGYHPGSVRAFDAATGADLGEVGRAAVGLKALAVSPDGRRIACVGGPLTLLGLDPPAHVARHKLGRTHFLGAAFHPSGGFFATANGD